MCIHAVSFFLHVSEKLSLFSCFEEEEMSCSREEDAGPGSNTLTFSFVCQDEFGGV